MTTPFARKLTTDTLVGGVLNLLSKAQGLILIPVLVSQVGVSGYGAVTQLLVLLSILTLIVRLDLPLAFVHLSQSSSNRSSLYSTIFAFILVFSLLITVILIQHSERLSIILLSDSKYEKLFAFGILSLPVKILSDLADNFIRSEMELKKFNILRNIRGVLELGAIVIGVLFISNIIALIGIFLLVGNLLYYFPIQIYVLSKIGISKPKVGALRKSLSYSLPLVISKLGDRATSVSDRFLLGYFIGPSAVGVYSAAYGIANLITVYQQPLTTVLFTEFSRLYSENKLKSSIQYFNSGIKYYFILAIPTVVGFIIIGGPLLGILAGQQIQQESYGPLVFLSVALVFYGFEELNSFLLMSIARTKIVSKLKIMIAIINLVLNFVFIPQFGVIGAVFSTGFSYFVAATASYTVTDSIVGIEFPKKESLIFSLAAGLMGLILYSIDRFISLEGIAYILTYTALGVVIYFLLIFYATDIGRDHMENIGH